MKITLKNSFHNSETSALVKNNTLSAKQISRIERELCGQLDCYCPKWDMVVDNKGCRYQTLGEYDGSAIVEKII